MERSTCLEKSQIKKRGWSEEEDRLLITYVTKHGHGCWQSVPKAAGLRRSGKSCRLRWINYLRPDVKLGNFTEEEERIIIGLYCVIGSRWSKMARQLPGRTDYSIRNYWNTHLRRRVSTTTRSLFPSGEYDGNNIQEEEENIPEYTDKDLSFVRVNDPFWEHFLTINPTEPETVHDTGVAESEDFLKLVEQNDSEPPWKSSTEFNIQNENDEYIANYTACLPHIPEDLQNERNMIFHVDSSSDPPVDIEDALQNVRIALGVEQSNGKRSDSSKNKKRDIKMPSQREYITTKLSFSLEVLKQHFGMTIDDAADSLSISRSSLKRICRENGIERWPSRKRKKTNRSPLNLKAAEEQIIESNNRETANIMNTIPHITVPLQDSNSNSSVTIKATYGDDIIKFKLSLSSGMEDLREKVAKRLGLEVGSFKLKHKDDAGDLVLITCDEDLQDCVDSSSRSLDKATIAMLVLPLTILIG